MNAINTDWVRVELHLHSDASGDSLLKPQQLIEHCARIGIDRVAITDHNSIEGALAAYTLAPERVIVGEEIETTQGELLGYFMSEWVPPGLAPMQAIERLRDQDALISVSHPFDRTRSANWSEEQLARIAPYIDAIEVFNARCLTNAPNHKAAVFAQQQGLLGTVGSDAHSLVEVGRAALNMPAFDDAASFLASLPEAQFDTRLSSPFVHLRSRFAAFSKWLGRNFKV